MSNRLLHLIGGVVSIAETISGRWYLRCSQGTRIRFVLAKLLPHQPINEEGSILEQSLQECGLKRLGRTRDPCLRKHQRSRPDSCLMRCAHLTAHPSDAALQGVCHVCVGPGMYLSARSVREGTTT